jgi:predicted transcriptional regulator
VFFNFLSCFYIVVLPIGYCGGLFGAFFLVFVLVKLTAREMRVLYGLVRWPGFSDVELSKSLGLGRTTVTVVRQRLERRGFVSLFYVPDFRRVGCELLTTLYGEFSGSAKSGLDVFRESIRDGVSTVFYMIRSGGQHLSLGAAESLTKVREQLGNHHRIHHESGYLTDKRHNYVFFPLGLTHIPRFFDYAPLLAEHFGFEHEGDVGKEAGVGCWEPTRRERDTFNALVNHPGATDEDVASHAGVSRQTVNILRNRFLGDGLIRPVRVPDVSKLGFGLLAFTHLHLSPHSGVDEQHVKSILEDASHVLKVSGDLESVVLSVYKDYGGFKASHDRLVGEYRRRGFLSDEPVVHLYPLDQTEHILNHSYGSVVSGLCE